MDSRALAPGCAAACASKKLCRRFISSTCLHKPVECLSMAALRAVDFCLWKRTNLLFFFSYYHNVLFLWLKHLHVLVRSFRFITALRATENDCLLLLCGQKS